MYCYHGYAFTYGFYDPVEISRSFCCTRRTRRDSVVISGFYIGSLHTDETVFPGVLLFRWVAGRSMSLPGNWNSNGFEIAPARVMSGILTLAG